MLNRKDAPEGFYAERSNPKNECKGCHWETSYKDRCPHINNDAWCSRPARKDGLEVIFIKEES